MTHSFQLLVSLSASPTGHGHGKVTLLLHMSAQCSPIEIIGTRHRPRVRTHWAHPRTGHGRGRVRRFGVACTAMATSTWKTLKVESEDLKVLMIVRALPCGAIHLSVDPFHDYVRPKMPLSRWSSEVRFGSDLGQWWLRFCSALVHDLASVWVIAGSFAPKPILKQSLSLSTISEHNSNPTRTKPEPM